MKDFLQATANVFCGVVVAALLTGFLSPATIENCKNGDVQSISTVIVVGLFITGGTYFQFRE